MHVCVYIYIYIHTHRYIPVWTVCSVIFIIVARDPFVAMLIRALCMYVCMYVFMYVYVCAYGFYDDFYNRRTRSICCNVHTCTLYVCMYICMHVCEYINTYPRTHCTHLHFTNVCIVCMYVCKWMHAYPRTYMHTHTFHTCMCIYVLTSCFLNHRKDILVCFDMKA